MVVREWLHASQIYAETEKKKKKEAISFSLYKKRV